MTLVLDDDAVRTAFSWDAAVTALREAYAANPDGGRFPSRRMARGDHGWLRTLSGVPADPALMGLKVIAAAPTERRASYLIPLFDQRTAELVALVDGQSITGFRTAATSALAVDVLARREALRAAVIGSGFEARHHVRALAAVRDLASVSVFSPRPQSRERFASDLADLDVVIHASSTPETAVAGADVVLCAARSYDETPTLQGDWLRPGVTVVSIGSTLPEQREVDAAAIERADVLVADAVEEVLHETGDLVAARDAGCRVEDKTTSLADVVGGRHPGRTDPGQVVLYKSVGSAVQDLAVAEMCLRIARERGAGVTMPDPIRPVEK